MKFEGLTDIHFHGQAGIDVMTADRAAMLRLSLRLKTQGVSGFLATFISSPKNAVIAGLERIKRVAGDEKGARILGVHLEGPFLHGERKGTHNPRYIRPPDVTEVREWLAAGEGLVKLVTLAPEVPGNHAIIRLLDKKGIRVSMGHSTATHAQARQAKAMGVTSVTHLCNAMNPLHHRDVGLLGFAMLDSDLYTEVIADGVHVSDEMVQLIFKTRPADKIILISDGFFLTKTGKRGSFAGMKVKTCPDGSLRKLDGTLAGSNATLPEIVKHAIAVGGLPRDAVIAMASRNPLRLLGLVA